MCNACFQCTTTLFLFVKSSSTLCALSWLSSLRTCLAALVARTVGSRRDVTFATSRRNFGPMICALSAWQRRHHGSVAADKCVRTATRQLYRQFKVCPPIVHHKACVRVCVCVRCESDERVMRSSNVSCFCVHIMCVWGGGGTLCYRCALRTLFAWD